MQGQRWKLEKWKILLFQFLPYVLTCVSTVLFYSFALMRNVEYYADQEWQKLNLDEEVDIEKYRREREPIAVVFAFLTILQLILEFL